MKPLSERTDASAAQTAPSAERWARIKHLFHLTLERPLAERAAFLDEACGQDVASRDEVLSLLDAHRDDSFIEHSPGGLTEGEDRAGSRLGPYLLLKEIGRGGMGAVYGAVREDAGDGRPVALKVLKRGMDSDVILRRFLAEREILAALDHPHIARLLDGGSTPEGLPYLVMEHIEGQPLVEFCDARALKVSERLALFRDLCAAVQYAHQRLVVHRDIKPANVLVTVDASVKLLDFGLAKILSPVGDDGARTQTAFRALTPEYASPEQIRGEPLTTATDVFSLGVVLYELLTGCRPFDRRRVSDDVRRAAEAEAQRPSERVVRGDGKDKRSVPTPTAEAQSRVREGSPDRLRRRLKGDLDHIVGKALALEPERRYGSVERLSEDVRRHLEGLPVAARPDTLRYRARKFLRRHRVGAAAAAAVTLSLLGGIAATAWQARRAETERARAERRFADVRNLAHAVVFELHDAIEKLPGSTPARELLVERALTYLDRLAGEPGGDAGLLRELAAAYQKIGDVQGNPYFPNLGDLRGASRSYERALALREEVRRAAPDDPDVLRDLATSHERVGDVLAMTGDLKGALQTQRRGLAIREALARRDPQDPGLRRDLATSHNKIGDDLGWSGDTPGALASHRRALELRKGLADEVPGADARTEVGMSFVKIGEMQMALGETDHALESFAEAITWAESAKSRDAASVRARRTMALGHGKTGEALAARGDLPEAIASQERARVLRRALLTEDPANRQAQRDLAVNEALLADAFRAAGRSREAVASLRASLGSFEALAEADAGSGAPRLDVAIAANKLGDALLATGDARGTIAACRRAAAVAEPLAAADPEDVESRRALAEARRLLGEAYTALASAAEACRSYALGLASLEELGTRGALGPVEQATIGKVRTAVARCQGATTAAASVDRR